MPKVFQSRAAFRERFAALVHNHRRRRRRRAPAARYDGARRPPAPAR
jgi:hypothetical protein